MSSLYQGIFLAYFSSSSCSSSSHPAVHPSSQTQWLRTYFRSFSAEAMTEFDTPVHTEAAGGVGEEQDGRRQQQPNS
jgi:hypothetical protein